MKFTIGNIDRRILNRDHNLKSVFRAHSMEDVIEIRYTYKGEPNNGRVILALQIEINQECALRRLGISSHVELPYQYPTHFEILNSAENTIAIPHTKGIYLARIDGKKTKLIEYKSSKLEYTFFIDNQLVVVESKFITIVELTTLKEQVINLSDRGRIFVNGVKLLANEIHVIVFNAYLNDVQMLVFDRSEICFKQAFDLSKWIHDQELIEAFDRKKTTKLVQNPVFRFPSIISSWRYLPNVKKNALVGMIRLWEEPTRVGEGFERIEKSGIIEINLSAT